MNNTSNSNYVIMTDTCADLPASFYNDNNIDVIPLCYSFGQDEVYGDKTELSPEDFYFRMRNGEMPTTMAANPEMCREHFLKFAKDGKNVIYIVFSSGLSSTYQNAVLAAEEVMEEYPDIKINVIDSLAASMGEGIMVYKAVELKNKGMSFEEVSDYILNNRLHFAHQFTVDDLFHLYRGGRVSRTAAIVGTLANIKPLLHVDNEGHLINIGKVRGRKKSLNSLVDKMEADIGAFKDELDVVGITHGDCLEDAQYVAEQVKKRTGKDSFIINMLCPTIGTHTGPGLVALFYMAEKR